MAAEDLQLQIAECFERQSFDSNWVQIGQGTVLWAEGPGDQQRLLVVAQGDDAREIACATLPDESLQFSLVEENMLVWSTPDGGEIALAFLSEKGCEQVWSDVVMLQSFEDGIAESSETPLPSSLPPPAEAVLPELVALLELLATPELREHAVRPHLMLALAAPEAVCTDSAGSYDYIGGLDRLFRQCEEKLQLPSPTRRPMAVPLKSATLEGHTSPPARPESATEGLELL